MKVALQMFESLQRYPDFIIWIVLIATIPYEWSLLYLTVLYAISNSNELQKHKKENERKRKRSKECKPDIDKKECEQRKPDVDKKECVHIGRYKSIFEYN
jgi:hypothetical protein